MKFDCNAEAESAMHQLKQALTEAPILGYPNGDSPYIKLLDTNFAIGAVLSQPQDGEERVIAYISAEV